MSTFLDTHSLKILMSSYVLSRLDYCNSLLAGLPEASLDKLQRVQNHAARVVLKRKKRDHVTPMFIELHWLPVRSRISYKIALLCYKCLNRTAPQYLCDLLEQYVPTRSLRSSDQNLIRVTNSKTKTWGGRAFSFFAPSVWNSLPQGLRDAEGEIVFKNMLKTHFFATM